jgi:hypothetical protein
MSPDQTQYKVPLTVLSDATGAASQVMIVFDLPVGYAGTMTMPEGIETDQPIDGDSFGKSVGEVFYFDGGELKGIRKLSDLRREWHINFTRCEQQSQVFGTDNEHTIAKIFFTLWSGDDVNMKDARSLEAIINQPAGESFSFDTMPLVVVPPPELENEINYSEFRDKAEEYYRFAFKNMGIGIGSGSRDILFGNNTIAIAHFVMIAKADTSKNNAW